MKGSRCGGRALRTSWLLLLLSGCLAHRGPPREWLVYVQDVPVAKVALAGASHGNVVDVAVRGGTAEVTLQHQGPAVLEPVQEPPGLKVALRQVDVRALAEGHHDEVERVLAQATPLNHDDDTALAVLRATTDDELARTLESERGRFTVAWLYMSLTRGSLWDDEREQAWRILAHYAQRMGPERFARAVEDGGTKVVPLRGFGMTVEAPISMRVALGPGGLDVTLNSKVYRHEEWMTLGGMHFHVAYDEVVGVKLLDEGGATRFAPALYLLEVANQDARRTMFKCGEAFAYGLTLGAGAAAGAAGGTGGRAAATLRWCDRAAVALGAVTSVVDEHRGWILERFGAKGARFLRYSDGLATMVSFYAVGRVAVAVPWMLVRLRNAYLEMRALRAALSAEEKAALDLLGQRTDEALRLVEDAGKRGGDVVPIEQARGAGKARQPVLAMDEVEIRATGTDGRLVPAGDRQRSLEVMASAGEGGGARRPLPATGARMSPEAPPAAGGRPSAAVVARATAASEIVAALVRRGLTESQAQAAAQYAAQKGVLEQVRELVKRPGYRNPERLPGFLRDWKPESEGKIQALEDALARLRKGNQVALEGNGADVVDYTAREAIQHKRIFGEGEGALRNDLRNAAKQLRGETGELPPKGFTRIADVRFDPQSKNPLKAGDRNALRAAFPRREELEGVDRVLVTSDRSPGGRPFEFEPPYPLF